MLPNPAFSTARVSGTTAWTITGIPLPSENAFTIEVRATDTAGNTTDSIIVVRDLD